ncbi:reverse transcriptase domain-containing protein [Bacillus thuringiensis]|nr:reverse transcriptase domain-containing protein [Bacillus thuringiensis]
MVRYADDFKIFCRTHNQAKRIFHATNQWLRERLGLEISEEKSSITNLKKKYTEFLGFKLKVVKKPKSRRGYVAVSDICGKAVTKIKKNLKDNIKSIQLSKENKHREVQRYNEKVIGYHNYYQVATRVNPTLSKVAYVLSRIQYNRLKNLIEENGKPNRTYKKLYGNYNFKIVNIAGITLFPLAGIKFAIPNLINPKINNYTIEGRKLVHAQLKRFNSRDISILFKSHIQSSTIEFNDNRISLFIAQQGKCAITKTVLSSGDIHCHHKLPKNLGGTDKYENLIIVTKKVHKLIHAKMEDTISKLLNELKLADIQLKRVNTLRKLLGNKTITL